MNAEQMFKAAFEGTRMKRSDAYKAGVLSWLRYCKDNATEPHCSFPLGSPEADAFFAGISEGRALAPLSTRKAVPSATDATQYEADFARLVQLAARNEQHGMRAKTWPHPDCTEGASLEQRIEGYQQRYLFKEQKF